MINCKLFNLKVGSGGDNRMRIFVKWKTNVWVRKIKCFNPFPPGYGFGYSFVRQLYLLVASVQKKENAANKTCTNNIQNGP